MTQLFFQGPILNSPYGYPKEYNATPIINEIRTYVEAWRRLPNPNDWQVTPETARLLKHWRRDPFHSVRPFFCQVEAVKTVIWFRSRMGKGADKFWEHIKGANEQANPELPRLVLKTGHRRGQDDGHGDADRLADGQCRPLSQQQDLFARGSVVVVWPAAPVTFAGRRQECDGLLASTFPI